MVDKVVAEAASTVDEVVAEATSTTDEVVAEDHPRRSRSWQRPRLWRRRVVEAVCTADEVAEDASTMDKVVAEAAPTV